MKISHLKKYLAFFAAAFVLAFASSAFAAESGSVSIAVQNVSNVTVDVPWLPTDSRISTHSSHAPIAVPDEQAKKITFHRGSGYREGKYVYSIRKGGASEEIGTFTVWVLDVAKAITVDDAKAKVGGSAADLPLTLMPNFSFSDEPTEPVAWEMPRGANNISNIAFVSDKFTISPTVGFTVTGDTGVALVTINGVLKYSGEFIEGAKDSGTLGSCYFVVNDFDVDKASATWAAGGALSKVEFKVTGLAASKITKVYLNDSAKTELKKDTDYKASGDPDATIEITPAFLAKLPAGPATIVVEDDTPSTPKRVFFVVRAITGADPAKDVAMTVSDIAAGDPIVASLDVVAMQQIKEVGFDGKDVTPLATFTSRRDGEGRLLGSDVHLPSLLTVLLEETSEHTVVVSYDMSGTKAVSAKFKVVANSSREVPATISPDISAGAPKDVDFSAVQNAANRDHIALALNSKNEKELGAKVGEYFDGDGKLTDIAARALIKTDEQLVPLSTVISHVSSEKIAPITFIVTGDQLVSGDHSIDWTDAHIYKIVSNSGKFESWPLTAAPTMDDVADGRFQIFDYKGRELVKTQISGKHDGTLSSYRLVVYVKDNGDFDLDGSKGVVVDPVVLAKNAAAKPASSSGGSCATGAFALAAAAAMIAIRRRGK